MIAGLTNSIWSALIGLAVVPLYLKYLGMEAYGLIGIFTTAQALFGLLDLGLAPAINRQVARGAASGDLTEARELLHTLSGIYWATSVFIVVVTVAAAPVLAHHWLQSKALSNDTVASALMLIGVVIGCRWPIGLYLGALIGAERVSLSSAVSIAMATLSNAGAVIILAYVSPTIQAFFIWQACVGIAYAAAMRAAAWHAIGRGGTLHFSKQALAGIWRFSAGISGIALSALLLTQIDKVILSRLLSLSEFGRYTLATLVVSGLYLFITPVFNVIYPRFSALHAQGKHSDLESLYRLGTRLFGTMLFPIAMVLAVFAEDLVRLWTGDAAIASSVAVVIPLLAIGSALHGVMYFPYALQLANGLTRLPLKINIILVIVAIPLMTMLAFRYGVVGGAAAWLLLHVLYLLLGTLLTHRLLLRNVGWHWLVKDVGMALGISVMLGVAGVWLMHHAVLSGVQRVCLGIAMYVAALALSLLASRDALTPGLIGFFKSRRVATGKV